MKKIPLDQARPGMVLAQQIVRHDGVLLAQKGAELTEPMIRMLERLNFVTVPVESLSSESPEERQARITKEIQALKYRFARVSKDPILVQLARAMAKRIYEGN